MKIELPAKLKEVYLHNKYIVLPIFVGISSVIILTLVIIPQLLSYFNTRSQLVDTQKRFSELETKALELKNIDEEGLKSDLQIAFTVLPIEKDVLSALANMQALVAQAGLELVDTGFSTSQKQAGSKGSFQLNVTVLGPISSLRNFLIRLQDSPQIFQVKSINVHFQKEGSLVEAEIPVDVFYQAPLSVVGTSGQPVSYLSEEERKLLAKLSTVVAQFALPVVSGIEASGTAIPLGRPDPFE